MIEGQKNVKERIHHHISLERVFTEKDKEAIRRKVNRQAYKRKAPKLIAAALVPVAAFLVFALSQQTATEQNETAQITAMQTDWKLSPGFQADGASFFGIQGRIGVPGSPFLTVNEPAKYMWHFWGKEEQFLKKDFQIIAVSKETRERITVASMPGEPALLPNHGADMHFPSSITLPSPGLWRLEAYFGNELFGSVVVEAEEQKQGVGVQTLYEAVKQNDTAVLQQAQPIDMFKLYIYCANQQDWKTQYELFIRDAQYERPFPTYEDYEKQVNKRMSLPSLTEADKLQQATGSDGINEYAYIVISEEQGLSFQLTKDEQNIWRVNWLPFQ